MRLLHAVETFSRRGGGLPVAVSELAGTLADSPGGPVIELLGSAGRDDLTISEVVAVFRIPGAGLLAGMRTARWLADRHKAAPITAIHQHGLWAPLPVAAGGFARRRKLPLVISPHGMLEPWALRHHAGKKRIAWKLYQGRNLDSAGVLHATSEAEAGQFRSLGLSQPIAVLPLGVAPVPDEPLDPAAAGAPKSRRQILMLSRIHPKKGIDLLIDAWAGVDAPDWELVIAGNDDGDCQPALEAQAARLDPGDRIRFAGPLYGAEKDTAFRRADLFVLPSHSENFGIVVPEALQYGLPVITTTGTPWEQLERENCGWQVEPEPKAIAGALGEAVALTDAERRAMGEHGVALVKRDHHWPQIAARFVTLYRWLAGEDSGRPDWLRII